MEVCEGEVPCDLGFMCGGHACESVDCPKKTSFAL